MNAVGAALGSAGETASGTSTSPADGQPRAVLAHDVARSRRSSASSTCGLAAAERTQHARDRRSTWRRSCSSQPTSRCLRSAPTCRRRASGIVAEHEPALFALSRDHARGGRAACRRRSTRSPRRGPTSASSSAERACRRADVDRGWRSRRRVRRRSSAVAPDARASSARAGSCRRARRSSRQRDRGARSDRDARAPASTA